MTTGARAGLYALQGNAFSRAGVRSGGEVLIIHPHPQQLAPPSSRVGGQANHRVQKRLGAVAKKPGSRRFAVTPFATKCRREDSNLHSLNGNQVLNLNPVPFRRVGAALRSRLSIRNFRQLRHYRYLVTFYWHWAGTGNNCSKIAATRGVASGLLPLVWHR